jgi:hypothetical protein
MPFSLGSAADATASRDRRQYYVIATHVNGTQTVTPVKGEEAAKRLTEIQMSIDPGRENKTIGGVTYTDKPPTGDFITFSGEKIQFK